jgi:hypothetical protein
MVIRTGLDGSKLHRLTIGQIGGIVSATLTAIPTRRLSPKHDGRGCGAWGFAGPGAQHTLSLLDLVEMVYADKAREIISSGGSCVATMGGPCWACSGFFLPHMIGKRDQHASRKVRRSSLPGAQRFSEQVGTFSGTLKNSRNSGSW